MKVQNKKMIFICAPLCVLAVLLSWISILVSTNGVISANVYAVSALDLIISLCEISIYATSLAFIVYAIAERKRITAPFTIFLILSAIRYLSASLVRGLAYGAVTAEDFISAAVVFVIDAFLFVILVLISYAVRKKIDSSEKAAAKKDLRPFMPDFSKVSDKSLFIAGVMWASIKLISQIIYDISYITIIGAPSATNIVWMVIYYLFAILICPVFYLIASSTVRFIGKGQDKSF